MNELRPWFGAAGILLAAIAAGYVVTAIVVRRLRALFEKTETQLDDLLLAALERHVPLWFLLAGLAAGAQAAPLREAHQLLIHKAVVAGFFISVTLGLSRFLSGAVRLYSVQLTASEAAARLGENLTRLTVMVMGAMLLLSNLGISIAPVLTALGVGSLAVALALQDTLANLFAGIHIVASRMVEVDDYVKLDSGQEGFIVDIGWRTTRLRDGLNNLILVPNGKLSGAIITNYNQSDPQIGLLVQLGAAYGADLDKVEKIALEVAAEVQKQVPGGVREHVPALRFHTFADSSINYAVVLRAASFIDQPLLKHEFIKRANKRFAAEGIDIPFPQRVVHLHNAA